MRIIENTKQKKNINICIMIIALIVSAVLLNHNINNLRKNGVISPVLENVSIESQEEEFTSQLVESTEKALEKLDGKTPRLPLTEGRERKEVRSRISSAYESFMEGHNISTETKATLIDLFTEKEIEILDLESESGKHSDAELRRERDYLEKYYNEKISKFSSPELFNSYWAFYRYKPTH